MVNPVNYLGWLINSQAAGVSDFSNVKINPRTSCLIMEHWFLSVNMKPTVKYEES